MSLKDRRATPAARFRLTRYFLTASLLGMLLVTGILIAVYRDLAERQLVEHETRASTELTRVFLNAAWPRYRGFVAASAGRSAEALRDDPLQQALLAEVRRDMRGLRIAKVKIYNLAGVTVFSTDARQVGEDKRGNAGFERAKVGQASSLITFRASFDAFEGEISNRNLISTYVPAYRAPGEPPEAVFELYSDVTEMLAEQRRSLARIVAWVLGAVGALYAFQYVVVRKAAGILAAHDRERARREDEVRHLAYHDGLTGLPNRMAFGERLAEALAQAARRGGQGAVLFIDLDRFKLVNDSLGHDAGDELLRRVAERIGRCLRAGDHPFRMGGDEFAVVLGEVAGGDEAAQVARRIAEAVAQPVALQQGVAQVGASIGIALLPRDGSTPEALLSQADAAMYRSKQAGRSAPAHATRGEPVAEPGR